MGNENEARVCLTGHWSIQSELNVPRLGCRVETLRSLKSDPLESKGAQDQTHWFIFDLEPTHYTWSIARLSCRDLLGSCRPFDAFRVMSNEPIVAKSKVSGTLVWRDKATFQKSTK